MKARKPSRVDDASKVWALMSRDRLHLLSAERFWCIGLDADARALDIIQIGAGDESSVEILRRHFFRAALLMDAVACVAVHNHPGGDPTPSEADHEVTRCLRAAGDIVGIQLLDHVVIARAGFVSIMAT